MCKYKYENYSTFNIFYIFLNYQHDFSAFCLVVEFRLRFFAVLTLTAIIIILTAICFCMYVFLHNSSSILIVQQQQQLLSTVMTQPLDFQTAFTFPLGFSQLTSDAAEFDAIIAGVTILAV